MLNRLPVTVLSGFGEGAMKPYLDPVWGDRRQELVFIGVEPMNEVRIRAELDTCLVDAPAFLPDLWRNLPDPFPAWSRS